MKCLRQGICLALLGAGLAAIPGMQASATGSSAAPDGNLVQQMRNEAQGKVALRAEQATGNVGFIRAGAKGDLMPSVQATSADAAAAKATAYLQQYGAAFGAAKGQLRETGVTASKPGWTITYEQFYKGVPVFGAMLKANVDRAGDLTSVNGYAAPGLTLSTTPQVSASDAAARAIGTVRANPPGEGKTNVSGLKAVKNDLVIYRIGSTKGEAGDGSPGLRGRGHQPQERPRRGLPRREHRQVGQPLLDDPRRAIDRELYEESPGPANRSGRRATPSRAP